MTETQLKIAKALDTKVRKLMAQQDAAFLASEMMSSKIKIRKPITISIRSK